MLKKFSSPMFRRRRSWLYSLIAIITALSIAITTPQTSYAASWWEILLRGAQIYQLSNLSDQQEVQLGKQINQQLVGSQMRLSRKQDINRYVNQIGQRLAKNSTRPNIPYTFSVIDKDDINAAATMGGFVYINTGLIKAAENEAELASVMAHEIGHIAARHAVEQLRQRALAGGVLSVAGLDQSTAVRIGVDLALNLPHSRDAEREADRLGLENLQRAGYASSAMVTFMEKLLQQGGRTPPPFLSSHPATSERIRTLRTQIDSTTANNGDGLNSSAYRRQTSSL